MYDGANGAKSDLGKKKKKNTSNSRRKGASMKRRMSKFGGSINDNASKDWKRPKVKGKKGAKKSNQGNLEGDQGPVLASQEELQQLYHVLKRTDWIESPIYH